jgi:hypothetical protein
MSSAAVDGIGAYNFNIAEAPEGFVIEVVGSTYYDPMNADWACEEAWTSRPYEFFVPYADVGRERESFLANVCASVKDFIAQRPPEAAALLKAEVVTVGFVDGDLVTVAAGRAG